MTYEYFHHAARVRTSRVLSIVAIASLAAAGCDMGMTTTDGGTDARADVRSDVAADHRDVVGTDATDVPLDMHVTETGADVATDVPGADAFDAGTDAAMDAGPTDTGTDVRVDVVAIDVVDAAVDSGVDAATADTGVDVPTGTDAVDAPVDAGVDVPVGVDVPDAGSAACAVGHVVISEVRSRGAGGASDEFVELFNASTSPVTLDATWTLDGRSTTGASYTVRWTGATVGAVVPPFGHYLIAGSMYVQTPAADATLSSGITDASSVRISHSGTVIDAVCYYFDATTQAAFAGTGFSCEGTPVSNLPHNNVSAASTNVDVSIERHPGGTAGNCTDTDNNATDFFTQMPATPLSSASAPTP